MHSACVHAGVCVRASVYDSKRRLKLSATLTLTLLTCSRSPLTVSKQFCVCQLRESLNELAEAIVHRQGGGCWGVAGYSGKQAAHAKGTFYCANSLSIYPACFLNLRLVLIHWRAQVCLRAPAFSSGSPFLLLSLLFSVAQEILSSLVTACLVCIPLSTSLPTFKVFSLSSFAFLFHTHTNFHFTSISPLSLFLCRLVHININAV